MRITQFLSMSFYVMSTLSSEHRPNLREQLICIIQNTLNGTSYEVSRVDLSFLMIRKVHFEAMR